MSTGPIAWTGKRPQPDQTTTKCNWFLLVTTKMLKNQLQLVWTSFFGSLFSSVWFVGVLGQPVTDCSCQSIQIGLKNQTRPDLQTLVVRGCCDCFCYNFVDKLITNQAYLISHLFGKFSINKFLQRSSLLKEVQKFVLLRRRKTNIFEREKC